MDLRKFKRVAILLLLIALILLTAGYLSRAKKGDLFPRSAAEDLAALMEREGLLISPDQIPLRRETRPIYLCRAADGETAKQLLAALCSSPCKDANLTENGFLFRMVDESLAQIDTDLTVDIALERPFTPVSALPTDEERRALDKRLRGMLIPQSTERDLTAVGLEWSDTFLQDNRIFSRFALTLDGTEIYGALLTVSTDAEGQLLSLAGNAYLLPLERKVFSQQSDQLNILATELQAHKAAGGGTRTILSVSECYIPALSGDEIRFLPAWKITYADGTVSVYNTVNKEKYGMS